MNTIKTKPLVVKEVSKMIPCHLCNELATVCTQNDIYLCGIPGNHPQYDDDVLIKLVPTEPK